MIINPNKLIAALVAFTVFSLAFTRCLCSVTSLTFGLLMAFLVVYLPDYLSKKKH